MDENELKAVIEKHVYRWKHSRNICAPELSSFMRGGLSALALVAEELEFEELAKEIRNELDG